MSSNRQAGGYATLDSNSGDFGRGHDFFELGKQATEATDDSYLSGAVLAVFAVFAVLFILSVMSGVIMFAARKLSRRESPPGFYNLPPPAAPFRGHINNMANNEGEVAM